MKSGIYKSVVLEGESVGKETLFKLGLNAKGFLPLPVLQGILFVAPEEILFAQAEEKFSLIQLASGEKVFTRYSLKDLLALLPESDFMRPHQSYIVHIASVRKIQKELGNLYLILTNKTAIPISRRNKDGVFGVLGVAP